MYSMQHQHHRYPSSFFQQQYNPWASSSLTSRDPFSSLSRMLEDFNFDDDFWDYDTEDQGQTQGTTQSLQQSSAATDDSQTQGKGQGGQLQQSQTSGGKQQVSSTQRGGQQDQGTMTQQQRRDLMRSGDLPRLAALRVHNHKDRLALDFEVPVSCATAWVRPLVPHRKHR